MRSCSQASVPLATKSVIARRAITRNRNVSQVTRPDYDSSNHCSGTVPLQLCVQAIDAICPLLPCAGCKSQVLQDKPQPRHDSNYLTTE